MPYDQLQAKLITLVAGGQPPDGTSLGQDEIKDIIYRGILKELDPYIAADSLDTSDFYDARLKENQVNNKQYGLPIDRGTSAIYYNKDMFDAAGLSYPDPNWSSDDILSVATKLTVDKAGKHPNDAGYSPNNVKHWGFQYDISPYRFFNVYHGFDGAEYFDKKVTKTLFNTPEVIKSMQ